MDLLTPKGSPNDQFESGKVYANLSVADLADHCLRFDDCTMTDTGAVVAYSGKFTGRIPKDKFIVEDAETCDKVWWVGNSPISREHYQSIRSKAVSHLRGRPLYVIDAFAGADPSFRIKVRFTLERPYHALFIKQLLIQPTAEELEGFEPDWILMDACRLFVDPASEGTRTTSAILLDFGAREVVIAGTEYAGEIKKSIFTVMNCLLPQQGVMSMHCSANRGKAGDTALFFGLSGTGKTTLSADPARDLIGDDEHGWSDDGIFNIEGGCYAKCVNLSREREPEIWDAIKEGAILENVVLDKQGFPDYGDISLTENTRVAYPLNFIPNSVIPSVGPHPKNVVFLTCDALGLLPPISRLTPSQVLFYFLNGYSAKVAGTEVGVTEPALTFSACFGQPFLPLAPQTYGALLGEKISRHQASVWLINTGWTGGGYGVGKRISLHHTRRMLEAALAGELDHVPYEVHPTFDLQFPTSCPDVPSELLNPRLTWPNPDLYTEKAINLQQLFEQNSAKYIP
jgi:phosphoenolpyruvate carboxykinase (ATP)